MREDLVGSVLENLLRGLEGAEALGGEEGSHARHSREPLGPGFDECPPHPRRRLPRKKNIRFIYSKLIQPQLDPIRDGRPFTSPTLFKCQRLGPGFDERPLHPRQRLLRVVFS